VTDERAGGVQGPGRSSDVRLQPRGWPRFRRRSRRRMALSSSRRRGSPSPAAPEPTGPRRRAAPSTPARLSAPGTVPHSAISPAAKPSPRPHAARVRSRVRPVRGQQKGQIGAPCRDGAAPWLDLLGLDFCWRMWLDGATFQAGEASNGEDHQWERSAAAVGRERVAACR